MAGTSWRGAPSTSRRESCRWSASPSVARSSRMSRRVGRCWPALPFTCFQRPWFVAVSPIGSPAPVNARRSRGRGLAMLACSPRRRNARCTSPHGYPTDSSWAARRSSSHMRRTRRRGCSQARRSGCWPEISRSGGSFLRGVDEVSSGRCDCSWPPLTCCSRRRYRCRSRSPRSASRRSAIAPRAAAGTAARARAR